MKTIFIFLMLAVFTSLGSLPLIAQNQLGGDIDGEAAHDNAGYSISLSAEGQKVAIGASGNDANGNDAGQVRVFEWNGTEWSQIGEDIDGEAAHDGSGRGVSLSPDGLRVAIGAYMNDVGGTISEAGHVRVYEWDGIEWTQLGEDIDGKGAFDWTGLGESISIIGNRVAVGAAGNGNHVGYVRVFEWNDVEWLQLGEDIDGEAAGDASGRSVSLSNDGNRIAIGAPSNGGNGSYAGHVRVYEWNGTEWAQMGQDIDGEAAGDASGGGVSLSDEGHRVAIGASFNGGNGDRSGHTRVYEWNGGEWTQVGEDIDGKGPEAQSGRSVSLSSNGNTVAIGGCTDWVVGFNPGHVRVYKWNGTAWVQYGEEIEGEGPIDWSGHSVSISSDGQIVAIGAHLNDGNGEKAGHVRVFDLSDVTSTTQDRKDDIVIIPNPTTGSIKLTGIIGSVAFTVMDNFGKVVMKGNNMNQDLDLSDLSAGIYYLQLNTERGLLNRRIIKL
ncbi:MAG: T9SS type A sorting domain-containing protein [Saprospiraceae bacterium]|nr:T9SS type A sorting domain-containing protein [Saprospiraceae bacterium]MCB9323892.1 T9SS type A sorting domain-containing protein [Lewinellaceae bacterium]